MDTAGIQFESLDDKLQSQILGKLNFMSDILTGKIEAPPGITIDQRPRKIDKLMKAVQSHIDSHDDSKQELEDNKHTASPSKSFIETQESTNTLSPFDPPTKIPSPLFTENALQNLSSLNQHSTNPTKYPLSNDQIIALQRDGFIVIDDFIDNESVIKKAQNEINTMQKSGKLKSAGLRRLNQDTVNRNNFEITGFGAIEINGIYEKHSDLDILNTNDTNNVINGFNPLSSLQSHFRIIGGLDTIYILNDTFYLLQIETTSKLSLFVQSPRCWILCAVSKTLSFPVIYYVADSIPFIHSIPSIESKENVIGCNEWKCIGGVLPIGNVIKTNKWICDSVRSDLHCWLHSDDKDIDQYPALKECIVSMDYIRVQLNKSVQFESNTTQVQVTLYPAKGTKYRTHIDEPQISSKKEKEKRRRITCLLYLNVFSDGLSSWKEGDGGCLRIHLGDGKRREIEPIGGRLVVFNSQWIPHQVLPCYFNRYAITLWIY